MKIPRDLKPGDVIVDNHGVKRTFVYYHSDGDAQCSLAKSDPAEYVYVLFRPDGNRVFAKRGHAIRIERAASKRKPTKPTKPTKPKSSAGGEAAPLHVVVGQTESREA